MPRAHPDPAPPSLDAVDRRLLALLQRDCALTNDELARRAHVSPPTALRRVRRLVASGVIERRVAIVSPEAAAGLTAILEITLDMQTAEALAEFEARAVAEPAVQQCYRVATGPDFVLIVRVTDLDDYHALVHRALTAAANVRNVRSFFAVRRAKFDPAVAVE